MQPALFTKVLGDRTLDAAIRTASDLGYDAVEIMARAPHLPGSTTIERARELRELLDEEGLTVSALATYTGDYGADSPAPERELAAFEQFLPLADELGTDLLRHAVGGPAEPFAEEEDYETAIEWYRRAADRAADYEKTIAVELHADKLVETSDTGAWFIEQVDRSNIGIIHDAGNLAIVGETDGYQSVKRVGDALAHVHVKDLVPVESGAGQGTFSYERPDGTPHFQHRLLGHGSVDYAGVLEALADSGYQGSLTIECHRATDRIWTDETIAAHELEVLNNLIEETS